MSKMSKADLTNNWRTANLDLTMAAYRAYDKPPVEEKWFRRYRCEVCDLLLSKKVTEKQPVLVEKCGHILCLTCAKNALGADKNIVCPVTSCVENSKKSVTKPEYGCEPKELEEEKLDKELEEDYNCPLCDNAFYDCTCVDKYISEVSPVCYCRLKGCDGDCGTLVCGCIDQCRCIDRDR